MNIKTVLKNILEATHIYYLYIDKYSDSWNKEERKISYETIGTLIIYLNQVKELIDYKYENDEEQINNCLLHINNFSQYIKITLENFI